MSERPHLPNAPITEAVLDVQVALPEDIRLRQLEVLHGRIHERYPKKRTRKRWEGTLELKGGDQLEVSQPPSQEDGYLFISSDDKQIVQARLDGFTFSRLKPYQTWEALRDEAKELWGLYVDVARPKSVTRLGLRYINRMELPLPLTQFQEYVRTAPEIAPGIPQGVQSFFMRLEIPDPSGALAVLTETILPAQRKGDSWVLPFILDIDVIRAEQFSPTSDEIWVKFEDMRKLKNDIFFNTITPKAEALFQ